MGVFFAIAKIYEQIIPYKNFEKRFHYFGGVRVFLKTDGSRKAKVNSER